MPRTIDSLSTKKESDPKPAKAGSIVRPSNTPASSEKPAPTSRTLHTEKSANKARRQGGKRFVMRLLKFVVIPALLIVIVAAGYLYFTKKPTTINGQEKPNLSDPNVKEKAVKAFDTSGPVATLTDSDRDQVRAEIGAKYMAAYVAGFAPTQEDLNQFTQFFGVRPTKEQVTQAYNAIIDKKLELIKTTGYYEGYVFYFWYGRSIVNKLPEEDITGWGDAKVLADDKAYADSKANEYRTKLQKGEITESGIINALEADNRLQLYDEANGAAYYKTSLSTGIPVKDDGRAASIDRFLQAQDQLGITPIATITADPGYPASGKQREVGYVFAKLTTLLRGQAVADYYEQQLALVKGR